MIQFHQPLWIFIGLGITVLTFLLCLWQQRKRQKELHKFATPEILGKLVHNVSPLRRTIKTVLIFLAIFCLFVTLARPQYGFRWLDVKRKGIDILFAIDTSKSMLAQDIKPNRLERARYAILDFVEKLEGDRVGLMPFAGSAYLMCPLTTDYQAFENSLLATDTKTIPKGGTNIPELLAEAEKTLNNNANHKILIIVTDGENLQGDIAKAATTAKEQGLTIFTVGVGTPEGELVPTGNNNTFIKDGTGKYVTSKLDEAALVGISAATGGISVLLENSGAGLDRIYTEKLKFIPKTELKERRKKVPIERFEWPLMISFIALFLEMLIGEKPMSPFMKSWRKKAISRQSKSKIFLLLLLLLPALIPGIVRAGDGEDAYAQGDYLKATEIYSELLEKKPNDQIIQYNSGTASYKNNMFESAIEAFTKSLASTDIGLQEKAYYNLGNSYYQKGVETVQAKAEKTIEMWEKAVESYDASLALNSNNRSAKKNRTIVEKKLEELKKQQEQQQKENKQQDQDKKDNQDNSEEKQDQKNQQSGDDKRSDEDENKNSSDRQQQDSQQQDENNKPTEQDQKEEKPAEPKSPANEQEEGKPKADNDMEQPEKGKTPLQPGQMSPEEARRLLETLKDEEGDLNFVPRGATDDEVENNW